MFDEVLAKNTVYTCVIFMIYVYGFGQPYTYDLCCNSVHQQEVMNAAAGSGSRFDPTQYMSFWKEGKEKVQIYGTAERTEITTQAVTTTPHINQGKESYFDI